MKLGKTIQLVGLFTVMAMVFPLSISLGAEGGPDIGSNEKIVGPTVWAVGVVDCVTYYASLRIKSIDGCVVDTDHLFGQGASIGLTGCPDDGVSDILDVRLPQGSVLEKCDFAGHFPIITKVKNYIDECGVVSFDEQINFVVPSTAEEDVCQ